MKPDEGGSFGHDQSKPIIQWNEKDEILNATYEACQERLRMNVAYPHQECSTTTLEEKANEYGYASYKRRMTYSGKIQEIEREIWLTSHDSPEYTLQELKEEVKTVLLQPPKGQTILKQESRKRILIDPDYSNGHECFPVTVYSDLLDSEQAPGPSGFEYISKNIVPDEIAEETALKRQCNCTDGCSFDCSCVMADLEMNEKYGYDITTNRFHSEPKFGQNLQEQQYNSARIMCGDQCGCSSDCPFRYENLVRANKYEICKTNHIMGFSLRTLSNIREGEPIVEFLGEVVIDEIVQHEWTYEEQGWVNNYAFELSHSSYYRMLKQKLKKIFSKEISQDSWKNYKTRNTRVYPFRRGNIGRFLQHSCTPNAVILRIVTNDLRLEKHHLVVVAGRNIAAGEEITIDYGLAYFKNLNCLCDSILCDSKKGLWRPLLDGYKDIAPVRRLKPKVSTKEEIAAFPVFKCTHPVFEDALDLMEQFCKNLQIAFDAIIDEFSTKFPSIKDSEDSLKYEEPEQPEEYQLPEEAQKEEEDLDSKPLEVRKRKSEHFEREEHFFDPLEYEKFVAEQLYYARKSLPTLKEIPKKKIKSEINRSGNLFLSCDLSKYRN